MAKLTSKGTLLKLDIASVYTTVSQMENLTLPEMAPETVETPTLDQSGAGIPSDPNGWTQPGELGFDGYLDPALSIHKTLLGLLAAPAKKNWKIVFSDSTEWPCEGILNKFGGSASRGEFLKYSGGVKLADLPTFPA